MSDKLVFRLIAGFSCVVFLLVIILHYIPKPANLPGKWVYFLPKLNAILNGSCFVLLLASLYYIKQKNIVMHKRLNITAIFLSSLFLLSYVIYHYYAPSVPYGSQSFLRTIYLFILITHIILAAVVLPLALLSLYWGLNGQINKHRQLVRWSYPIWLYVTLTGVIIYLMISPYYNHM